jgi:hypothetical protein
MLYETPLPMANWHNTQPTHDSDLMTFVSVRGDGDESGLVRVDKHMGKARERPHKIWLRFFQLVSGYFVSL